MKTVLGVSALLAVAGILAILVWTAIKAGIEAMQCTDDDPERDEQE